MSALLATAHLKGPHVDFAGLSPLIALLGGATIVLLVGLLGSSWVRSQRRSDAQPGALGAAHRADASGSGTATSRSSPGRCGSTRWRWC